MFARLIVLAAVVALFSGGTSAVAQQPSGVIPDHYIVVLKDDVPGAQQVANEHAQKHAAAVSQVYEHALKGYSARIPSQRLNAVRNDPRVLFISQDREIQAVVQSLPTGVKRIAANVSSTASGNGSGAVNVPVAVIDTGSGPHSDLNIKGGKNCSTGKSYNDGNGHGTHVAGTIGARDNTAGVVGIAPGTPIYSVRVLNNAGSGSWGSVICGIDWVTANGTKLGIKVANMSLGGSGSDSPSDAKCGNTNNDALHMAICRSVKAGITYVVAAGNDNADLSTFVPAAYDEVLTVTAIADFDGLPGGLADSTCRPDADDTAADFSNFTTIGSPDASHTIAAPGVCVNSTWKGGGYSTISGTSMASPHVAGVAALCISGPSCAGMTPSQVVAKLRLDAAAETNDPTNGVDYYGFTDDPNTPSGSRYYGYLTYAGGY